eukprot:TRINITY_DN6755_c0_g1_i1.p1 TRINITY_DN6755_c0_g1~~TRINITY_DN6755_c0_g1_i1.p1  ORF type:complete len:254 (-),score=77.29 TRINITY_DN6755_c0_g1_i1:38-799(-)
MRRGIGITKTNIKQNESLKNIGNELKNVQREGVEEQLKIFKEKLEEFAKKYKHEIGRQPEFRQRFHEMCSSIGVDPLASGKGFWADLLGVGDFYYELGVRIISVCMKTKGMNGGLIEMNNLIKHLNDRAEKTNNEKGNSKKAKKYIVSKDDIERSISKLKVFGGGYQILKIGNTKMIQSIPTELSTDHTNIIELSQKNNGFVTLSIIKNSLKWEEHRIDTVLNKLMTDGMIWIDTQSNEKQYWFPSLIDGNLL